jgi:hypothetical protein
VADQSHLAAPVDTDRLLDNNRGPRLISEGGGTIRAFVDFRICIAQVDGDVALTLLLVANRRDSGYRSDKRGFAMCRY